MRPLPLRFLPWRALRACVPRVRCGLVVLLGAWMTLGGHLLRAQTSSPAPPASVPTTARTGAATPQVVVGGDQTPPGVTVTPAGATVRDSTLAVTVLWCDNQSLSASSHKIVLDGNTISSTYQVVTVSGCGAAAISTARLTFTPGTHQLAASISDNAGNNGSDSETYTYTVPNTYTAGGVTATVVSPRPYHDPAQCTLACGELVQSYTTPAYVSQDVARNLTFVYRSGRAYPHPMVEVDVGAVPANTNRIGLKLLTDAGAQVPQWGNNPPELVRAYAAGVPNRLAVQFDPTLYANPAAAQPADFARVYTAVVSAYDATGALLGQNPVPVRVAVDWLNGPASVYGAGWGLAGASRFAWTTTNGAAGGLVIMDASGELGYWDTPSQSTVNGVTTYTYPPPQGDFSTVTYNSGSNQLTRTWPDGHAIAFNSDGRTAWVADRLGNRTTFGYASTSWGTGSGTVLRSVTDPSGHAVTFTWRGEPGYPSTESPLWKRGTPYTLGDGLGRTAYYGVDTTNSLGVVMDPDGQAAFHASYYGAHLLWQWQDRRGAARQYTYDGWGTVGVFHSPPGARSSGDASRVVTYAAPWTWAVLWGQSTGGTLANPAPALPSSQPRTTTTDAAGHVTRYHQDGWGAADRVEAPGGVVTTATRDHNGHVTQTVDARGNSTTYTWDWHVPSLLDSVYTTATAVGTAYGYTTVNGAYLPQQVRVNGNVMETLTYSGGRLATDATAGVASPTTYDYTGQSATDLRPAKVTDPRGHVTTYAYATGGLQNTSAVTTPLGTTSTGYDAYGRVGLTVSPAGDTTTVQYDLMNRPTQVIDGNHHTTTTAYDALYARTVTDAANQQYRDSVSALGVPFFSYDPGGHATATTYDTAGRVAMTTNRRGQWVEFGYDATLGTLTSRTTGDGYTATYGTDSVAHLRWASNWDGIDSVFTDAQGRDTLAVHHIANLSGRYTVRSQYDSLGRRVHVTTGSSATPSYGDVMYAYDAAGGLASVTDGGATTTWGYDNEELPTTVTWPNGVTVTNAYNAAHGLASRHYSQGAVDAAFGRVFSYDNGLRVTSRFNSGQTTERRYTYDHAGQLTGMQDWQTQPGQCTYNSSPATGTQIAGDGPVQQTCSGSSTSPVTSLQPFAWDAVGNPVRSDVAVAANTGNELTTANGQQLGYDADGNLTTRTVNGAVVQQLTWNSLGQLVQVISSVSYVAGGPTVTFGYDGWGRRVRKTVTANGTTTTTYFVWDGADLIADVNASGGFQARYTYVPGGPDQLFSVLATPSGASAQRYYVAGESTVGVLGLVDAQGAVQAQYTYQPFGAGASAQESLAGGTTNRFRFRAREYDAETGFYYNRARYYAPDLGRFVSQDPSGTTSGINLYAYAGNDPVNAADPTGLKIAAGPCTIFAGTCGDPLGFNGSGGGFGGDTEGGFGGGFSGGASAFAANALFQEAAQLAANGQGEALMGLFAALSISTLDRDAVTDGAAVSLLYVNGFADSFGDALGQPKIEMNWLIARNSQWIGCKQTSIFIQDSDQWGQAEVWDLSQKAVKPMFGTTVGFYSGSYYEQATSYTRFNATGNLYCQVGVGIFTATSPKY
ncbi:MAG TPA: RHS repeat-associated core domain-containing protein [Gemmatirosa sp.]